MSFCPKYVRVGWRRIRGVQDATRGETHLDDVEELGHDGRDAPKERRARLAFHLVAETFDLDEGTLLFVDVLGDAGRIHVEDGGHEHRRWRSLLDLECLKDTDVVG